MKKLCTLALALTFFVAIGGDSFSEVQAKYSLEEALKDSPGQKTPKFLPTSESEATTLEEPAKPITRIIQNLINGITGITAAIAIFMMILNAQNIIFAAGDSDAISKGKKGLTWSIIALFLIAFAYVLVKTFIQFTYFGEVPVV